MQRAPREHAAVRFHASWAILLAESGRELARVMLSPTSARDELPLRDLAQAGLRYDAAALVVVRDAGDESCVPSAADVSAAYTARKTLSAIGLRLHDYLLWHGDRCVSLRRAGKL